MRSGLRLICKKARAQLPQLAGLILLLTVGVCFFITLFTIVLEYEETAERYFIGHGYADVTFYGAFGEERVASLAAHDGIVSAAGRTVRDYRDGERIFRAISLTEGINIPFVYEGRAPENEGECMLLRRNAEAIGLSIGDALILGEKTLAITGLAASPEYIYMVQNERTLMAQAGHFGVVYVTEDFFPKGYNEIVALTAGVSVSDASQAVGAFRAALQKDQPNHALYRSDMGEIRSFAYTFPLVFAVLIAVVIYVMLSRSIQKDRKQIGTMKALGMTDRRMIGIYLSPFCLAALAGALLGCVAAVFATDVIIGIFGSMFEVPTLRFALYPGLWSAAILVSILLCAVSGLIALFSILPLLPAHAMRPRTPKGGKRIFLENAGFLWKRLSFNTRYALKSALRNKGRFWAVVLGMSGSCALLAFSFGFYDSIGATQDQYFNGFANYDVMIGFDPMPLAVEHPAREWMDEGQKALALPVVIRDESYILAVTEKDFDMVLVPGAMLQSGVIVPEYFADMWGVEVGDTLEISGYDAAISAIVPQYLGLALYTGFDYIHTLTGEIPAMYNTMYGRSADVASLRLHLQNNGVDFTTIDDDKTSFDSIMESMSVLIWFMIACAIVLGFTVLYSVGLINLSAREYEYMFLGVMGYPHKSVLMAHIKESALQLVLAIPLGFVLGRLLLESIKGEFSGASFVIAAAILPQSYALSALSVLGVTAVMALVTSRRIKRLDMVEGLKVQDE